MRWDNNYDLLERVLDPWHREAFIGTAAEGTGRRGRRQKVWFAVDWCGNLVAEIGTVPPSGVRVTEDRIIRNAVV